MRVFENVWMCVCCACIHALVRSYLYVRVRSHGFFFLFYMQKWDGYEINSVRNDK